MIVKLFFMDSLTQSYTHLDMTAKKEIASTLNKKFETMKV